MKIAQTATAFGLLAASAVFTAVFTPAFAETPCSDFTRNPDGSWTPRHPFVVDSPTGWVHVDPGNAYDAQMPGALGRVAADLTLHCPGVPRARFIERPKPSPYLYGGKADFSRWGNQAISADGVVIVNPPPGRRTGSTTLSGTVSLNSPSPPSGRPSTMPS